MSVYSNDINLHLNEIALMEFRERTQNGVQIVASVSMTYETLRMMIGAMGEAIEQHDKKLNELQRTKANMN